MADAPVDPPIDPPVDAPAAEAPPAAPEAPAAAPATDPAPAPVEAPVEPAVAPVEPAAEEPTEVVEWVAPNFTVRRSIYGRIEALDDGFDTLEEATALADAVFEDVLQSIGMNLNWVAVIDRDGNEAYRKDYV